MRVNFNQNSAGGKNPGKSDWTNDQPQNLNNPKTTNAQNLQGGGGPDSQLGTQGAYNGQQDVSATGSGSFDIGGSAQSGQQGENVQSSAQTSRMDAPGSGNFGGQPAQGSGGFSSQQAPGQPQTQSRGGMDEPGTVTQGQQPGQRKQDMPDQTGGTKGGNKFDPSGGGL